MVLLSSTEAVPAFDKLSVYLGECRTVLEIASKGELTYRLRQLRGRIAPYFLFLSSRTGEGGRSVSVVDAVKQREEGIRERGSKLDKRKLKDRKI